MEGQYHIEGLNELIKSENWVAVEQEAAKIVCENLHTLPPKKWELVKAAAEAEIHAKQLIATTQADYAALIHRIDALLPSLPSSYLEYERACALGRIDNSEQMMKELDHIVHTYSNSTAPEDRLVAFQAAYELRKQWFKEDADLDYFISLINEVKEYRATLDAPEANLERFLSTIQLQLLRHYIELFYGDDPALLQEFALDLYNTHKTTTDRVISLNILAAISETAVVLCDCELYDEQEKLAHSGWEYLFKVKKQHGRFRELDARAADLALAYIGECTENEISKLEKLRIELADWFDGECDNEDFLRADIMMQSFIMDAHNADEARVWNFVDNVQKLIPGKSAEFAIIAENAVLDCLATVIQQAMAHGNNEQLHRFAERAFTELPTMHDHDAALYYYRRILKSLLTTSNQSVTTTSDTDRTEFQHAARYSDRTLHCLRQSIALDNNGAANKENMEGIRTNRGLDLVHDYAEALKYLGLYSQAAALLTAAVEITKGIKFPLYSYELALIYITVADIFYENEKYYAAAVPLIDALLNQFKDAPQDEMCDKLKEILAVAASRKSYALQQLGTDGVHLPGATETADALEKAKNFYTDKNYDQAHEAYSRAAELARDQDRGFEAKALLGMARCTMKKKDFEPALAAYDALIQSFDGELDQRIVNVVCKAWADKAQIFDELGMKDAELICYQQIVQRWGASRTEYLLGAVAWARWCAGLTYSEMQDDETDLEHLDSMRAYIGTENRGTQLMALRSANARGTILRTQNDYTKCVELMETTLASFSNNNDEILAEELLRSQVHLARSLYRSGDTKRAIPMYEDLLDKKITEAVRKEMEEELQQMQPTRSKPQKRFFSRFFKE